MSEVNKFIPAPIPKNEERRLEAVRRTGVMDVDNKDLFIIYNELAKQISNMPVSYTGLIDERRQYMICHVGLPDDLPADAVRENTFCQYALNSTSPLIVENCKEDHRFKYHPIVTGPPYVHFYGGFPIVTQAGLVLGTLCVTDTDPASKLEKQQVDLLEKLAGRLAHQLETQSAQREITASKTKSLLLETHKKFPNFGIKDLVAFLSLIEGEQLDSSAKKALKNDGLISDNGQMTDKARLFQKQIGLDSGIFRRIVVSDNNIQENLDNMLNELEVN